MNTDGMGKETWEYEHSIEGNVSTSALWGMYSDVSTWPEWDKGIEKIGLDGEFREGTSGTIKPVGQDHLPFRLTKVTVDGSDSWRASSSSTSSVLPAALFISATTVPPSSSSIRTRLPAHRSISSTSS